MEKKPVRILVTAPLGVGGISSLMINIQSNINRERLNFDYLTLHKRTEPQEEKVIGLGSHKYVASADNLRFKPLRFIARLNQIRKICKENEIKIFHNNEGTPKGVLNVLAAKAGGVKYVTYHSHNGGTTDTSLFARVANSICRPIIPLVCDDLWACSALAAQYTFPKRISKNGMYYFMPNAVDLNKFGYSENVRTEVRKELGLEDKFIIGHAGRFNIQKNHEYLIDIFSCIYQKDRNAVLVLFGVGELFEKIQHKVKEMHLEDVVYFYGASDCMERMYNAMDVFLMPSLFEGLPVTGVEAQASGLPIVFSDTITKEVCVAPNVKYISLNDSLEVWADAVINFKNVDRRSYIDELSQAGFDQDMMIRHFETYYLNVADSICKKR